MGADKKIEKQIKKLLKPIYDNNGTEWTDKEDQKVKSLVNDLKEIIDEVLNENPPKDGF